MTPRARRSATGLCCYDGRVDAPLDRCPRCPAPRRPGATECPACGVIYARARPRPPAAALAASAAAAVAPGALAHADRIPPPPPPLYLPSRRLEELLLGLAQLLEAGLTLRMGLSGGAAAALPKQAAARLEGDLAIGLPLSEALDRLGVLDLSAVIQLLAGERTGTLPAALREVAQRFGERRADRNQMLFLLLRPAITLLAGTVILPVPLLFTAGSGAYARAVIPGLLSLAGAAVFVLGVWPRLSPESLPKRLWRAAGLQLPLIGAALRHDAWSTFAEVLGAGIRAGLPVREALVLSAGATPHPRFQDGAGEMVSRLDKGTTLTEAIQAAPLPQPFLAQVQTAELSGTLDRTLAVLQRSHRELARSAASFATSAIALAIAVAVMGFSALTIVSGFSHAIGAQTRAIEEQIGK
jgi:type II secretory pathway component PulF